MSTETSNGSRTRLYRLAAGAIGVVFGDIGTSPLYAFKEAFGEHGIGHSSANIIGVLSLFLWSLILVVSVKYATFILRADNKGEGGIMALMMLAQRGVRDNVKARWLIMVLGIFGASLFFGDGVITPAISVLSAVEGLQVAAPGLDHWVVPITVLILIGLFSFQRHGTGKVGAVFAPITAVWFLSLAALGLVQIVQAPQVLAALSPHYGIDFLLGNGTAGFFTLGAVVLSVTGAEALYADMGHFGKKPIRMAWFGFVLPALVLNYFGQGALLLSDPSAATNPFYRMIPEALLFPMIILAAAATVIASQAVISGAFSVAREAIHLGYLPRMQVLHTSAESRGQIYLPWINRMLLVLTIAVVLGFQSSTNLAAAYGIAVVGTMTIDSVLVMIVSRRIWGWSRISVFAVGLLFLTIDGAFLGANADKVEHGGWFPLVLGIILFAVMTTWRRGRDLVMRQIKRAGLAIEPFVTSINSHPPLRVPGTAIFMTANQGAVPNALLHNLKHNKVLHERNVLLTVETLDVPTVDADEHVEIETLSDDFFKVVLRYGFAEDQNVPQQLMAISECGLPFDMMDTTFFLSRESIVATDNHGMPLWRDKLFAFLQRNALPATAYFEIPGNRLIELGTQVEI
ncbi:potassium transporter Kup [Dokdonella immobilis]|uniref:Probable potassium transport system protein Kup n=1 Tax=Dokdonella immobilis TaxID=578942 RepID=A0A1I4XEE2_9GAMM|nr:potassium transporter Kup [Dokdonella immobilis]SFN24281.1 KUP system potassium uptake protein [Dokdonella immobilis]